MPVVDLTYGAVEALRSAARFELDNSIQERLNPADDRADHERVILACADVLGELGRPREPWTNTDEPRVFEFSPAAFAWIKDHRDDVAGGLADVDPGHEPEYEGPALVLLRVLDRVLTAEAI